MKRFIILTGTFLFFSSIFAQPLTPPQLIPNPANDDEYFFNFRLTYFAPNTEPLIVQTFGADLQIEEEGFWVYNSYTSCAISFSTNLPTITVVEYGKTQSYGDVTTQSDSYYYRHLHHLKGLESNTLYHYRIIAQDYDGNWIASDDGVFTTKTLTSDIIRIPEDFGGAPPPYDLTTGDAQYVLTQDMIAPTLFINIKAHNVEIDLDGHTVIYDNDTPEVIGTSWDQYAYNERASFGIRSGLWNFTNAKVFNGTIKQGANGGDGIIGCGFNPIFLWIMPNTYNEVAGVTIDYYGKNMTGMYVEDSHIHHNVIIDRGSKIDDRHLGMKAIAAGYKDGNEYAYNSLRRFRHQGIMGKGYVHHNELYSDSFDTNSFLIGTGEDETIEHNKLFGMGYMPIGMGWADKMTVKNNFIYLHGTAPEIRSDEYPRLSGIAGVRMTKYEGETVYENMLYEDNTISLKAWGGCNIARGIWTANGTNISGFIYRRNVVKVEAICDTIDFVDVNAIITCVDINGEGDDNSMPPTAPMLFEDNTFIGNVNLITFGSSYGVGGSARFYRNKMERINTIDDYFTPVRLGWWYWSSWDNYIIDAFPGEGIDLEQAPTFYGSTGLMEVYYGFTKKLLITCRGTVLPNTDVIITTNDLPPIVTATDDDGYLTFEALTAHHWKENDVISRIDYTPYTFAVAGYPDYVIAANLLKDINSIVFDDPGCETIGIETEIEKKNPITIYPNPAKDCFYLHGLTGNETIEVIEPSGRVLIRHIATNMVESIPVNTLHSGIYFVRITGNATSKTLKIVINK